MIRDPSKPVPLLAVAGEAARVFPSLRTLRRGKLDKPDKPEWYVACVKSNQDRSFAEHLTTYGVTRFIALRPSIVSTAAKTYDSQKPVFPGYVFFFGTPGDKFIAVESKKTFSIIPPHEIYQERLHDQLQAVHRVLEPSQKSTKGKDKAYLGADARPIPQTGRVDIIAGQYEGLTARILDLSAGDVIVEVDVLGQGIPINVPPRYLLPVTDSIR